MSAELSEACRAFLDVCRVAHLATVGADAEPHVVPVCFAIADGTLYVTIDEKPKRGPAATLQRVRNIHANPRVAVVADRYDEDWTRLAWVMLTGRAEILESGAEHDRAQSLLRARYPQLAAMQIAHLPVIAVRIANVRSWGNLCAPPQAC